MSDLMPKENGQLEAVAVVPDVNKGEGAVLETKEVTSAGEKTDAMTPIDGGQQKSGVCLSVVEETVVEEVVNKEEKMDELEEQQASAAEAAAVSTSPSADVLIEESVVTLSVNGDEDWNQTPIQESTSNVDSVAISAEQAEDGAAPYLEYFGGDSSRTGGSCKSSSSMEPLEAEEELTETVHTSRGEEELSNKLIPCSPEAADAEEGEKEKLCEDVTVDATTKEKRQEKQDNGDSQPSEKESSSKGKFVIQADLNINSRPKRSTPRRSVFELLQGEIKSTGVAKRSSGDTGSESDPEPGPSSSKRANPKRCRLSAAERLKSIDEVDGSGEEKTHGIKRGGKGQQAKGKGQAKDHSKPGQDEHKPSSWKESAEALKSSARGQSVVQNEEVFVADDFGVVESVVEADDPSSSSHVIGDAEFHCEADEMELKKIRAENPSHDAENKALDSHQSITSEEIPSGAEIGGAAASTESDQQLEYSCHWPHSYASQRQTADAPTDRKEAEKSFRESHPRSANRGEGESHPRSANRGEGESHPRSANRGEGGLTVDTSDTQAACGQEGEAVVDSKRQKESEPAGERVGKEEQAGQHATAATLGGSSSSTLWYMTGASDDTKALQNKIEELLAMNAELKARLKEVENKTATKKFNIDFHSRKFSRAREPVFGSPGNCKPSTFERKSLGGGGIPLVDKAAPVSGSLEKDLKEKGRTLERKEEKLRALDVELDERKAALKVSEGKLLRTERRLKEMEKTLEYRERVLRRMEISLLKEEVVNKEGDAAAAEVTSKDAGIAVAADGSGVGDDVSQAKLERKERELERLRMFLNEAREKLLPRQQRLTKWEAELRKKEDEVKAREQELQMAAVSLPKKKKVPTATLR